MSDRNLIDLALPFVVGICALCAVVNAFRYKSRGASAFALAGGFLVLGFTAWLYWRHEPDSWVEAGIGVAVVFLIIEFGMRAAQHHRRSGRP